MRFPFSGGSSLLCRAVRQRLTLTHQQMTPPPAPVATNPYHKGSLIFVMTPPPERSNKLAPRWKGPFFVKRIPNPYQVTYEDGLVWRTIHVNHAKPAKTPADGFPAPLSTPEPPPPPLGYLPRSLQRPQTRQLLPLPQSAAPTAGPTQPANPPAATSPSSRPATRSAANRNSAPRAERLPPAAPGRTNENSRMGQPLRRSARLTPRACHIKSQSLAAPAQSRATAKMARTYPLSLSYKTCLGHQEDPYSFSSLYLEDLHNGQKTYLDTIQQLINAILKSMDPTSHFALRAQVTPPGHQRVRYSMRAALWWLLPSDGDFRRAPNGLHYFLARQGRRVVLRGGNITVPYYDSRLNWVHDPAPPPSRRLEQTDTVSRSESSGNSHNSVPRNILDHIPSASRGNISSASRGNNSSASPDNVSSASRDNNSSAPRPNNSVYSHSQRVPKRKDSENKMSATATRSPLAVPLSPAPPKKCRIRKRREAQRAANRNAGIIPAAPLTQDERWTNQSAAGHAGATQPQPEGSDPTSTRRTAVYPPSRIVGNSWTNENSPFQIGLESSRNPGLYKPAVPGHQQDTQAGTLRVKNSGSGTSSPPYLLPRAGIVYPLLPRAHRPDTSVTVDAALPEPAAFQRQNQPPTVVDIGSSVLRQTSPTPRRRAPRKPSRKRRRNSSTAVFRPAKRSAPRGHWCD